MAGCVFLHMIIVYVRYFVTEKETETNTGIYCTTLRAYPFSRSPFSWQTYLFP